VVIVQELEADRRQLVGYALKQRPGRSLVFSFLSVEEKIKVEPYITSSLPLSKDIDMINREESRSRQWIYSGLIIGSTVRLRRMEEVLHLTDRENMKYPVTDWF
jgi:intergrase/recombinase